MAAEIEKRLEALERRIIRLETLQRGGDTIEAETPAAVAQPSVVESPAPAAEPPRDMPGDSAPGTPPPKSGGDWPVTRILGWGGATALVLAAAYLIRLAIVGGWLTPGRQVAAAVVAAVTMIVAGVRLREADREYASLLPAGGIAILFLSVYGAHLYYDLIGVTAAGIAVMAVCLLALGLCAVFASQLYAFFAVAGSYSAPFLLSASVSANLIDLIIYYSCWSVVFSVFAIWVGSRTVYLLAAYLALIGSDVLWRLSDSEQWIAFAAFQFLQLVIFTACAAIYSTRHKEPMTDDVALAHLPALLIFYALEYALLSKYIPAGAPWVAAISAGVLLVAYRGARALLGESLSGSRWLLAAYCAVVLFHAGYLESVPREFAPWFALALILGAASYVYLRQSSGLLSGPIGWVVGFIFLINYLQLISRFAADDVPASEFLLLLYAVFIYAGYYFTWREKLFAELRPFLIYAGHVAAMAGVYHLIDSRVVVSVIWAALALGTLLLALRHDNKSLGQSSLLIFALSALKVFAFDISDAAPVIRIVSLVALGASLYAGGWLYRKVETLGEAEGSPGEQ
jgi:uncharacterized membrane protein